MHAAEHRWPTPEEIMEFLDGEGPTASREAIAAHLAHCADCQAVAAEQRGISRQAETWSVEHAPASLVAPGAAEKPWTLPLSWLRQPRAAALTFSAVGVVFVLVTMTAVSIRQTASGGKTRVDALAASDARQDEPARRMAGRAGGGGTVGGVVGGVLGGLPGAPPAPSARAEITANRAAAVDSVLPEAAVRTPSVIRTATLRLVAKDFGAVRPGVEAIVTELAGFVDRMTVTGDAAVARQLGATLRVPGDRLAEALARLRRLGAVVEDTQGSEDVTDQVVDVDARLVNARATEKRLADILQNRTGKLSDVLEVEREIARVRLDIERLDAEKTNLGRRVAYATINLSVSEERKSQDGPLTLATRLRLAALDGLDSAVETMVGTLLFLLRAGPVLLLWALAVALVWLMRRKIFRPKGSSA